MSAGIHESAYRADIDGLRAIAVMAVVIFHADIALTGGFVGVDIFFVISGYLITGIVVRKLDSHSFSLTEFYARRVRRIFPAIFAMLAISLAVGVAILPPADLQRISRYILATSIFLANILAYKQSGYFETSSEYNPLLHMWTLSTEEQFYVMWPIFLVIISSGWFRRWRVGIIAGVTVLSLMLSEYWVNANPNAAFFLLPSRAWELSLGASLALFPALHEFLARSSLLSIVARCVGLAMVGVAIFFFSETTPFPGLSALIPCVGTALVIAAGIRSGPSRWSFLSSPPLVWVGTISYSIYIWHWPILVFARLILNRDLGYYERFGLIFIIIFVSWISWKFIEKPFRIMPTSGVNTRWILGGLAAVAAFSSVGLLINFTGGLAMRAPGLVQWMGASESEGRTFQASECLARGGVLPPVAGCLLGAPSERLAYDGVIWGDSHAAQFGPALDIIGKRLGVTIREMTKAGCAPIQNVTFRPIAEMRLKCADFNNLALAAILADKGIKFVILAARWDAYSEGKVLIGRNGGSTSPHKTRELFTAQMKETIRAINQSGRSVIIIGQVPLPGINPMDCLARARFMGTSEDRCATVPLAPRLAVDGNVTGLFQRAALPVNSFEMIYPFTALCEEEACRVMAESTPLYMDSTHLSAVGAVRASRDLGPAIESALRR